MLALTSYGTMTMYTCIKHLTTRNFDICFSHCYRSSKNKILSAKENVFQQIDYKYICEIFTQLKGSVYGLHCMNVRVI